MNRKFLNFSFGIGDELLKFIFQNKSLVAQFLGQNIVASSNFGVDDQALEKRKLTVSERRDY
jgi:hypothetical protein